MSSEGTAILFPSAAHTHIHTNTNVLVQPVCLSKAVPNASCSKNRDLDLRLHDSSVFLIFMLLLLRQESVVGVLGESFAQDAFSTNFL